MADDDPQRMTDLAFDPFTIAAERTRRAAVHNRLYGEQIQPYMGPIAEIAADIERRGIPASQTWAGVINQLTGSNGYTREQLWPERMIRSGASLPHDVVTGEQKLPSTVGLPNSVPMNSPEGQQALERVQDLSNLAIGGSLPSVVRAGGIARNAVGSSLVPKEKPWWQTEPTLTPKQQEAVKAYWEYDPFEEINYDLRHGRHDLLNQEAKTWVKDLKEAINNHAIPEDTTLYRHVADSEDNFGRTPGRKVIDQLNNMKVGDIYKDSGFTSTSTGGAAEDYGKNLGVPYAELVFKMPKGSKGMQFPLSKQGEVLLAPDTSFQLIEKDPSNNRFIFEPTVKTPAPVFYSGVENALEHTNLGSAPAEQWLATIKNTKGVKPEELDWIGLPEWLAERKGQKVDRADLQEFVRSNKVDVKEIKKQNSDDWDPYDSTRLDELEQKRQRGTITDAEEAEFQQLVSRENEKYEDGKPPELTQYHDYQLPGGKDYGELLLTLPDQGRQFRLGEMTDKGTVTVVDKRTGKVVHEGTPDSAQRYLEEANRDKPDQFSSSHWDEPNVLAHVRYNTRNVDGKKTLFLEEIQSDLHQAGRKKGYKSEEKASLQKVIDAERKMNVESQKAAAKDPDWFNNEASSNPEFQAAREAYKAENERHAKEFPGNTAPDAPFKKSWPELAFKRMLRYAADNGYDAIAWTPGETQAARYDLSKKIKEVSYAPDTGYLVAVDHNGNTVLAQQNVKPDKLPDYIGKEPADRLLKTDLDKKTGVHWLKGLNLKVGGEGMHRFYDDQLPVIANKYAKPHGAKVEKKLLDDGNEFEVVDGKSSLRDDVHVVQHFDHSTNPPTEIADVREIEKDALLHTVRGEGAWDKANKWVKEEFGTGFRVWNKQNGEDFGVFKTKKEAEDFVKTKVPTVHYFELPQSLRDHAQQRGYPLFSHGLMLTPVDHDPFEQRKKE